MAGISFSGLASGIDTDALIQSLSESMRTQRVKPNQDKITKLTDESDALTSLKTKLNDLRSMLQDFSSLAGGAIDKQGTSSDETVVAATASKAAQKGTYSVTVTQRAKNATFSFNDRFSTTTGVIDATINDGAAASPDRTVSFSVGTTSPQTIDVVLTSSTTAADFVTQFNVASAAGGSRATASLVNVGTPASPSYAIMINSAKEGLEEGQITLNSVGSEIAPAFSANTLSQAANATLTMSGVSGSITRSSNSITDIIPGVTLNLNSLGTSTISITDDPQTTSGKVQEWVDKYNEVVTFLKENNQITREEDGAQVSNVFAALSTTRVDDGFLSEFRSQIASANAGGGTAVNILADLGFETQRDGTLKFKAETFEAAVSSESSSANSLLMNFADSVSRTGGTIDLYTRFNGQFDTVINSNRDQVADLNKRIADAEAAIANQEASLKARYARLESLIGQMTSQQTALTSALAGLG